MKKIIIIGLILVALVSSFVLATQVTQEPIVLQEPKIIPIWLGDYFTGKILVINEYGEKYWCELNKSDMQYYCKLLGGN